MNQQTSPWPLLVSLQQQAMRAVDRAELGFLIANDTWHLVPYKQACVFLRDGTGRAGLAHVTGLVSVQESTPFIVWATEVFRSLSALADSGKPLRFTPSFLESGLQDSWHEWWPENAVFVPLLTPGGRNLGGVIYVRDEPWTDTDLGLLATLHETYAFCLGRYIQAVPGALARLWQKFHAQPDWRRKLTIGIGLLLIFPIHLSVLAPAEVIALQAEAVTSPLDGVVKTMHVQPNEAVKAGQLLFSLDDTTLRNRRDVARKALAVASADALAAQQKAFDSLQSKGDLASLVGKVREREAEVAYLEEQLGRVDVHASHAGIFAYGDPNDWIGKPVATGERIGQLAKPAELGILVWIPVADAIVLEPGASMRMYLQTAPLSALSATLVQTSYQATLSPDGVASYRVRGRLESGQGDARIGLRGVAKVYGNWRPLIYWVLRRPLGALRQWLGL